MWAIGRKTSRKEKALNDGLMVQNIMETIKQERNMAQGGSYEQITVFMMDNSKTTISKGKEHINDTMGGNL